MTIKKACECGATFRQHGPEKIVSQMAEEWASHHVVMGHQLVTEPEPPLRKAEPEPAS